MSMLKAVMISLAVAALGACGPSTSVTSTESASEIAAAIASGTTGAGTNVGSYSAPLRLVHPWQRWLEGPLAWAATACPYYVVTGTTCVSGVATFAYSQCTFSASSTASWNGSQILNFATVNDCNTVTLPFVTTGHVLTRTFGPNTTRLGTTGLTVTLNTTNTTGYYSPVTGGMTITGTGAGHSASVNGINVSSSGFSYTASTSSPLVTTVIAGARTITSGTMVLQNNFTRSLATANFNNVGFNTTVCYPQTGSIVTTFSNSTVTETLTFNGNTTATLVTNSGSTDATTTTTTVTLSHCF